MLLVNSPLNLKNKTTYKITNGLVYFFEHYYVTEINEGVALNYENSKDLIELVDIHFGDGRPFGVISNRVNSFAIDLLDSDKFKKKHNNAIGKAIVSYSETTTKFINLENYFCEFNRKSFDCLIKAENWITEQLNVLEKAI